MVFQTLNRPASNVLKLHVTAQSEDPPTVSTCLNPVDHCHLTVCRVPRILHQVQLTWQICKIQQIPGVPGCITPTSEGAKHHS